MTKKHTQLSLVQRYQIQAFLKAGIKQKKIALEIGVHPSTISRESDRNIAKSGQTSSKNVAKNAQRNTNFRPQCKPKVVKFSFPMKEQAVKWLEHDM